MTRIALLALALALLISTGAQAEQRIYYGPDGRVSAREVIGGNGSTTIYGPDGRVTGRTSTSGGTTTIYGSDGRRVGTVTKPASQPR
jgi:YD repeat-containing protein